MKTTDIRQPKQGYLTDVKQNYRDRVYDTFEKMYGKSLQTKKLLFLPANHDEEIKTALKAGFIEENMYAVDDNAAMLATAKWRKKYPNINVLGSRLGRAFERLKGKNIKIDVANLDLCTNLQLWMFNDLGYFIENLMSEDGMLGLTLLKGREGSAEIALAKLINKTPTGAADRIKICYDYIMKTTERSLRGKLLLNEEYKSGTQTMTFGVMHFFSGKLLGKQLSEIYEKLLPKAEKIIEWDEYFYNIITKMYIKNFPYVKRKRITRKGDKTWDPEEYSLIHDRIEMKVLDLFGIKRNKLNNLLEKYKKENFYTSIMKQQEHNHMRRTVNLLPSDVAAERYDGYQSSKINPIIYINDKAMKFKRLLWTINHDTSRHRLSSYGRKRIPLVYDKETDEEREVTLKYFEWERIYYENRKKLTQY